MISESNELEFDRISESRIGIKNIHIKNMIKDRINIK